MRFFLLILIATLMSCAGHEAAAPLIEVPPFLKRYVKKEKELIYLVVTMSPKVDMPTQEMIDASMKKFDPEIIITRYPAEDTYDFQKELSQCEQGRGCNPAIWTCHKARPRGIPCITADPYYSDILKDVLKKNVKAAEVVFFYTFSLLVRSAKENPKPLELVDQKIQEAKRYLNTAVPFEKNDFIRMYKEKMNSSVIKLIHDDVEPDANGNYLRRMSYLLEESKHSLILKRVSSEFNSHQRVMLVYGPYYFQMHVNQLEDQLGSNVP